MLTIEDLLSISSLMYVWEPKEENISYELEKVFVFLFFLYIYITFLETYAYLKKFQELTE